jgi:hypothetical protein
MMTQQNYQIFTITQVNNSTNKFTFGPTLKISLFPLPDSGFQGMGR